MTNFYQRRDGNQLPKPVNFRQHIRQPFHKTRVSSAVIALVASTIPVYAQTVPPALSILHSFHDGSIAYDGAGPSSQLIRGSDGNFYGTTEGGGTKDHGTIFKMSPTGIITILHNFGDGTVKNDGKGPSGLVEANDGNFYGITVNGGSTYGAGPSGYGYGTAFRMAPSGVVTILHSFGDGSVKYDGLDPSPLVQGSDGNFYGTTYWGGSTTGVGYADYGFGTVFKMTPSGIVTIMHSFTGANGDGLGPSASLIQAVDGNLYGTTLSGGTYQRGTFFSITPAGRITYLYTFGSAEDLSDGAFPASSLVQDANGNFFGTTMEGGIRGDGIVFSYAPSGLFTVLHVFDDSTVPNNGTSPNTLLIGSDGNFYGTTPYGSTKNVGNVYRMTPDGTVTILHSFEDGTVKNDGGWSFAALTESINGDLFGTTDAGGSTADPTIEGSGFGTVFRLATMLPPPVPLVPILVRATPGNARVTLNWKAAPGATAYNVYRGTTSGHELQTPIAAGISTTAFIDNGLKNGGKYYYWISAQNSAGASPHSFEVVATPVSTIPAAPTGLTAAVSGAGNIALVWKASADAISYNIYRGTSPGAESATPIVSGLSATSYINTGSKPGTTYYYTVRAINAYGLGAVSNEAHAILIPSAPIGLKATPGPATITLTWNASVGATSYSVYRGLLPGYELPTPIASGLTTTTFTNVGLTPGETYYYMVTATNASGEGPRSIEINAAPALTAPTGLAISAGNGLVHLTWYRTYGAAYYKVYRGPTPGGESTQPIAVGLTTTNYADLKLTNGKVYYYKVSAYNTSSSSPLSTEVHAIPSP